MKRIIFVCSGNICRSPMAAGMAKSMLTAAGIKHVVISAGTLNIQGQPAAPNAVEAAAQIEIDISGHRSQGVSAQLMKMADHIIVMSPHHAEYLERLDRGLSGKIHRLWEYAEPKGRLTQIDDPVGLDLAAFVKCREEMDACLAAYIRRLKRLG